MRRNVKPQIQKQSPPHGAPYTASREFVLFYADGQYVKAVCTDVYRKRVGGFVIEAPSPEIATIITQACHDEFVSGDTGVSRELRRKTRLTALDDFVNYILKHRMLSLKKALLRRQRFSIISQD